MPIPTNKDELAQAIKDGYEKLCKELTGIPPDMAGNKELEGHAKGTAMSVKNLVAYLLGWGKLVLKWNNGKDNGTAVDFPETGYKWNELGKLAQKFYSDHENESYDDLLIALDDNVNAILALISTKSNEALYETDWYEKWPLGRMIQLNTSSPYLNAKARIRKWKKEKGLK